ncbi:hypothetical protein WME76_41440 [Sorangium sp. So ce119]|uniref:hypothetical protein n=1 Tax=Sorangium sp. So ce119 TaxID=3133279 RepID=UPI003F62D0F9
MNKLAILDEDARLFAPPREVESGPTLLALDDGFLAYSLVPGALHLVRPAWRGLRHGGAQAI